jgi:hypothetical protein
MKKGWRQERKKEFLSARRALTPLRNFAGGKYGEKNRVVVGIAI